MKFELAKERRFDFFTKIFTKKAVKEMYPKAYPEMKGYKYATLGEMDNITDKDIFEFAVSSAKSAKERNIEPIKCYRLDFCGRKFIVNLANYTLDDHEPHIVWELK